MPEFDSSAEYRSVPLFPAYKVSNTGEVWTCWKRVGMGPGKGTRMELGDKWVRVKPCIDKNKRLRVMLCPGRVRKQIHRLVLEAFVGPCPPGMICRHFPDPDPANCRLENLQWGTYEENEADKTVHGTRLHGETMHTSKLKEADVLVIRAEYRGKYGDLTRLGKKLGVSISAIEAVAKGRTWKHLLPTPSNGPLTPNDHAN
jgi:hypothetical protein